MTPSPDLGARPRPGAGSRGRCVLGLMSGTSGDGIDAVCIRISGSGPQMRVRLLRHVHRPFPPRLQRRLLQVMAPAATRTEAIAELHADLGRAYAAAAAVVIRSLPRSHRPELIGLAGQTVCHLPGPTGRTVTLQLGEPARVAAATGLPTVADFRQSDVAAGGQGAPLVPWTDWVLFTSPRRCRAVQNIGGIGNVTFLPPAAGPGEVIAFDTGPGNMIIDALVAEATGGRQRMDRDGRMASRGRVLEPVLERWLAHPFLRERPPKSTGREVFGQPFLDRECPRLRRASPRPEDWVATATAFTARSIAQAYRRFLPLGGPRRGKKIETEVEVIACGGGARNPTLLAMLAAALPQARVRPIDAWGIPAEAKEALSFAMLAAARLDAVPANLPQVTGAGAPAVLGAVYAPPLRPGPHRSTKTA